MSASDVRSLLAQPENKGLRIRLFVRGFLVTTADVRPTDDFPFYGNWSLAEIGGYRFLTHRWTKATFHEADGVTYFLLGHAYDPFSMQYEEAEILKNIAAADREENLRHAVDGLTGIFAFGFIRGGKLYFETDASGIQSLCGGVIDGQLYLSSHPQLVADLCHLSMAPFVKELVSYKWYYRVAGPYLPGDLTPFAELIRIVPDIGYTYADGVMTHKRFYPLSPQPTVQNEEEYDQIITQGAEILRRNMELVSKKWQHPAISLTGGIDSGTTFAAANGHYDRFTAFSYRSTDKEDPDCAAAAELAAHFGVKHTLYRIPEEASDIPHTEAVAQIIDHNNGYITREYDFEMRKRAYLIDLNEHDPFGDVEVKSWVSETIRAYWYKHYGRKSLPSRSPRLFRNIYKIFLFNRPLAHKVDAIFADFIKTYEYDAVPQTYLPADLFLTEVTWGSWGGMNISEMKIYSDITIIYNNRRFLDTMLRGPLADRISDQNHLLLRKKLNREQYDLNIRVINQQETNLRAFLLNVIFTINMHLPF